MKKLLACLLFGVASLAKAQSWDTLQNSWTRLDGGDFVAPGTVTSVGLSAPVEMNVSNSPVVASGTLGLAWVSQSGNLVLASPDNTSGIISARALVPRDLGANGSNGQCITQATATTFGRGACSGGSGVAADTIWDTKGDGVAATGADTAVKVPVGANGTYWAADSTATSGVSYINPSAQITSAVLFENEFCGSSTALSFNITGSGAGPTGNTSSGGASHPCIRAFTVGAATGSIALEAFNTNTTTVAPVENGGGSFWLAGSVNISSIGDGTDVVKYYLGGCSTGGSGDCSNGMYLRYDRSVSTTNWYLCAADNGTRTCNDTTIAVVVGANYTTYQITSNAANNSMSCIINGSACAAGPTTNLPGAGHGWDPMIKLDKTAGATTVFTVNVDFMKVVETFTARTS